MKERTTKMIVSAKAATPVMRNPNPIDRHVGSRVRMRRMIVGISQGKLGEALGLTFQQVQKYEKGTNRIGASRLQHIARVLGVPIEFFFEGVPHVTTHGIVGSDVAPSYVADFLSTSEGVQLTRAFVRVTDPKVRRRFISLVRAMAEDESE
jgi:transcriptional regulator with XRE-family HTH domain